MQTPSSQSSSSPSSFHYYDLSLNDMDGSDPYNHNKTTTITTPINSPLQLSQQEFMTVNTITFDPVFAAGFNNSSQTNELGDSFRENRSYLTELQSAIDSDYVMVAGMDGSFKEIEGLEATAPVVVPPVNQQNYEELNTMTTGTAQLSPYYSPPQQSTEASLLPTTTSLSFDSRLPNMHQHSSLLPASHINIPTTSSLQHQNNYLYTTATAAAAAVGNSSPVTRLEAEEVTVQGMIIDSIREVIEQKRQEQSISSAIFAIMSPTTPHSPQQGQQQSQPYVPALTLQVQEGLTDSRRQNLLTINKEKEGNKTLDFMAAINSHRFPAQSSTYPQQFNNPQSLTQLNRGYVVSQPQPPLPAATMVHQDNYTSASSQGYQQQLGDNHIIQRTTHNQPQQVTNAIDGTKKRIKQQEIQQIANVYFDPLDKNNNKIKVDQEALREVIIKHVLSKGTGLASSSVTAPSSIPLEIFKQIYEPPNKAITMELDNCYGNIPPSSSLALSASTSALALASASASSSPSSSLLASSSQQPIVENNNNQSSSSCREGATGSDFTSKQMPWNITRKLNARKGKHIASATAPSFTVDCFMGTSTYKNKKKKQHGGREEIQARQCYLCSKSVSRARDLPRHIGTHIKDPVRCEWCGRTYSRKDSERRHNKTCVKR